MSEARTIHLQVPQFFRKGIAYNTTGIGTDATVEVGVLPAGAYVKHVTVDVTTAFNGSGNNVIDVGTSSNDDYFVDGGTTGEGDGDVDSSATGPTVVYRGAGTLSAETAVYVTYTDSGSDATAGAAEIIVEYIADNDG